MDCWSSPPLYHDEFEKLILRVNAPSVTIDNVSNNKATLVKVDSANKRGSLLDVVQVLTDLNLLIRRAYISSDGEWFMDVFHVTDQHGNKLLEDGMAERIQQSLGPRSRSFRSMKRSVGVVQSSLDHTTIELTGKDRPGLLSDIFAVLTDHQCNVVGAEVWTHNSRMASVVYITDESNGLPIDDQVRVSNIRQLLLSVLKGDRDIIGANTTVVPMGSTHTARRLHQMMYADRDYDTDHDMENHNSLSHRRNPEISVENCRERDYTVVTLRCRDRPKLLFDTVCTITDMQYVVFHGMVNTEGPEAYQEYFIRHIDGYPIRSEPERQRVMDCLKAAIKRRTSEGIRLELCSEDRVGLLTDVTRIFRENGLSVIRAEVTTRGSQAVNTFYVTDASWRPVQSETIEAVRKAIGVTVLNVRKDDPNSLGAQQPQKETEKFSIGSLFKSRSEKFLYNLGLLKSFS